MTRRRPLFLVGTMMGAALLLGGCAAEPEATPVATSEVNLPPSYVFDPAAITVPDGTTVTWTNNDNFTHSVRLLDDGGAVLVMSPGESVSYTFEGVGTHNYDCSFHATDMKGVVIVTEAS